MDREKMVLMVVGLVLAVALLQAFQLSGLVASFKAAAASSGIASGGQAGLSAPPPSPQPLKALPSAAPSQVGGC